MSQQPDLIKAVRSGQLAEVVAALDAGAKAELDDGQGNPGLPLAMACFTGHAEIVRELILRGAKVNFSDNREATSPLSMALRGKRTEVIKVLIELGLNLPEGTSTGLTEQELMLAKWKAHHFGAKQSDTAGGDGEPIFEEIQVGGCYGTDTSVLDADMRRAVQDSLDKKKL